MRITEKKLRSWLESDNLFSQGGFKLSVYSGFYHIGLEGENGSIKSMIVVEENPRRCWESWNVFKSGVRFARTGMV